MEKHDKAEVEYAKATSADEQCQECRWYLGGSCEMVRGQIAPDAWCSLFDAMIDA